MNDGRARAFSPQVLIVDDEPSVRQVLRTALEERGYEVEEAASGEEALSRLAVRRYDLLLLDLRMAGVSGVEVMQRVRLSRPGLPIIILTGYATLESAIAAIRCGAADYLLKPVSIREIARAVERALQQSAAGPMSGGSTPKALAVGPLMLDLQAGRLTITGSEGECRAVDLTPGEAAVLACLMRSPGEVVTHSVLAREVWNLSLGPEQPRDVVRVVIHRLRSKIEADPRHPSLIRTVFGRGYRLEIPPLPPSTAINTPPDKGSGEL